MDHNKLSHLVQSISEQLPSLLTVVACMIFAIARWKRRPRVSLVVLIALALMFVHVFAFAFIYLWVPDWFIKSASPDKLEIVTRNLYLMLDLLSNTVMAVAIALLLAGIFMQREPRPRTSAE